MLVAGAPESDAPVDAVSVEDRLRAAQARGLSVRDAVAEVARETGRPRRDVYRAALSLKGA